MMAVILRGPLVPSTLAWYITATSSPPPLLALLAPEAWLAHCPAWQQQHTNSVPRKLERSLPQ